MKKTLETLKQEHAEEIRKLETELAIRELLPSAPVDPCISNIYEKPSSYCGNACISFSSPAYDPEKTYSALAVAQALEADGWDLMPCTRAKYGSYRRTMAWGTPEELPQTSSRSELVDCEPALPVWVEPQQFTNCDLHAWMRSPAGGIHRISIDIPGKAYLRAKEERCGQFGRDWHFVRGSGSVSFPDQWRELRDASGEQFASVRDCFCAVDTDQGLSGRITWQLDRDEQTEFPLSLSEIMQAMGIQ